MLSPSRPTSPGTTFPNTPPMSEELRLGDKSNKMAPQVHVSRDPCVQYTQDTDKYVRTWDKYAHICFNIWSNQGILYCIVLYCIIKGNPFSKAGINGGPNNLTEINK